VTAATLDSDENVSGRFALKTAVGELGVPLSPDSLVLPKEAASLPKSLRDAALGLLGKAYAVATAPAAALPRDVTRFSRKIVWDRAVEVSEAGFRLTLHEPLADTAAQLLMDFAGSGYARLAERSPVPDDLAFAQSDASGFDEIRRRSIRGNVFAQAVAGILSESAATLGTGAFHQHLATQWSYRAPHLSATVLVSPCLVIGVIEVEGAGVDAARRDSAESCSEARPRSERVAKRHRCLRRFLERRVLLAPAHSPARAIR
jgi:hypothetical protein